MCACVKVCDSLCEHIFSGLRDLVLVSLSLVRMYVCPTLCLHLMPCMSGAVHASVHTHTMATNNAFIIYLHFRAHRWVIVGQLFNRLNTNSFLTGASEHVCMSERVSTFIKKAVLLGCRTGRSAAAH